MLEFHRLQEDDFSEEISDKLKDMVVAYRTKTYSDSSSSSYSLPHIREGDNIISGEEELREYLYNLDLELQQQRSITGDGCYIDPETGEVC